MRCRCWDVSATNSLMSSCRRRSLRIAKTSGGYPRPQTGYLLNRMVKLRGAVRTKLRSMSFPYPSCVFAISWRQQPLSDTGEVNFERFVVDAVTAMDRQLLVLDDSKLEVRVGCHTANLPPKKYALYRLLAEVRRDAWPGAGPDGSGLDHRGWLTLGLVDLPEQCANQRFLEIYENLPRSRVATGDRSLRNIIATMLPDELRDEYNREIANTNRLLNAKINDYIVRDRVRIKWVPGDRKKGIRRRFGLVFEPHLIKIV